MAEPVAIPPEAPSPTESAATISRHEDGCGCGKRGIRVLIVEDSSTVRLFVRHILECAFPGADVVEARDGFDALDKLNQAPVKLIICDLRMPRMDGRSFLANLRHKPDLAQKPVLILSSDHHCRHESQFQDDPWVTILMKPATGDEIVQASHAYLELDAA